MADLAVLSADYFNAPDEEIKRMESVLTLAAGLPVHGAEGFASLAREDRFLMLTLYTN